MGTLIFLGFVFVGVITYVNAKRKMRDHNDDDDYRGGGRKRFGLGTRMAIGASAGYIIGKHMAKK